MIFTYCIYNDRGTPPLEGHCMAESIDGAREFLATEFGARFINIDVRHV
jgi:hypothetical protein